MSSGNEAARNSCVLGLLVGLLILLGSSARAEMCRFEAISNNSGVSGALAGQLAVEITPYEGNWNRVLFKFVNEISSPLDGDILGIFFDDRDELGGISELIEPEGLSVDFRSDKPGKQGRKNFPEGNNLASPFVTTAWTVFNGGKNKIGPSEYLGIVYDLKNGTTFQDLIDAIRNDTYRRFRIGVHVGGIANDESDSFVMTHAPVPGAVLLGVWGIGTAGVYLRRRRDLTHAS